MGWLTSYMNTLYFYKSFLRKVRSHLGEPPRLTGPAHPHMNSFLICFFLYIFIEFRKIFLGCSLSLNFIASYSKQGKEILEVGSFDIFIKLYDLLYDLQYCGVIYVKLKPRWKLSLILGDTEATKSLCES